jgi:NAD(P)-dependent dehydrogenase (short-subunit alcohol dehydrogenase family)
MSVPHTVITGTTHGIGEVTAEALARAGHDLTLLVRDLKRGQAQVQALRDLHPRREAHIQALPCELSSFASVRAAARQVAQGPAITHLINNAGLTRLRREWTEDGFETVFAVNQLGPFLLTELLRAHLANAARIINVASCAHEQVSHFDLSAVQHRPNPLPAYRPQQAYAQSKLANMLWTLALARRLEGSGITAHCLHPGVVHTHLLPWPVRLLKPLLRPGMISAQKGARTTLFLALQEDPAKFHGAYLDEHQQARAPSALARDPALQEQLWEACVRWTQV